MSAIPVRDLADLRKLRLVLIVKPQTLLTYPRLANLYDVVKALQCEGIQGCVVECGVWNGGSAAVIAGAMKLLGTERQMWLLDSWEGLPEPTPVDVSYRGEKGLRGGDLGFEERVREILFRKLRIDERNAHLIKGWFQETIPSHKVHFGDIALLHVDCDWYESTRLCLHELYDQVVEGGYVVIDDYGHWLGARKAVDEFLAEHRLKTQLRNVDYTAVCFRKPVRLPGPPGHPGS